FTTGVHLFRIWRENQANEIIEEQRQSFVAEFLKQQQAALGEDFEDVKPVLMFTAATLATKKFPYQSSCTDAHSGDAISGSGRRATDKDKELYRQIATLKSSNPKATTQEIIRSIQGATKGHTGYTSAIHKMIMERKLTTFEQIKEYCLNRGKGSSMVKQRLTYVPITLEVYSMAGVI
ncbi:hypothetical protein, partial [Endozoicomonas sp.]|uniref:hypothetical protein n=1 Tax=Endozoicomonas sp. TaxID=1892382 RepID=UPI003839E0CE